MSIAAFSDRIFEISVSDFFSRSITSALALVFRQREIDRRIRNPRPVEFGKQIGLARIGIGQAHGVTAASVEGASEMQNLGAAFAATGRHVFAHLPIHRRLQRVLDRERAAFDEEIALQRRQSGDAGESFDKSRVAFRINIRVRDLDLAARSKSRFTSGLLEIRMVEADGERAEKPVEIDQARSVAALCNKSRDFSRDR